MIFRVIVEFAKDAAGSTMANQLSLEDSNFDMHPAGEIIVG